MIKMKKISLLGFAICFLFMLACKPTKDLPKQQQLTRFLYKTNLDTSANRYGAHIEVKQILPKTDELIRVTIDDRDIISRSGYSRKDQIEILGEYLTFRGDKTVSNKTYQFKAAYYMERPEDIAGFTVEIEALYSFTRMLTQGLPPMRPMLINRKTGEELNTKPEVIREVYTIYEYWYKQNAASDFRNITLPLAGTPYCWLGEDKGMNPFLLKAF
jgi:hypothetical protein